MPLKAKGSHNYGTQCTGITRFCVVDAHHLVEILRALFFPKLLALHKTTIYGKDSDDIMA